MWGIGLENMSVDEVTPMAKKATPKASAPKPAAKAAPKAKTDPEAATASKAKASAKSKAAPEAKSKPKAAPKAKAETKTAAPETKSKSKAAPKAADAKKAAPKKAAPAIKLTDAQKNLLKEVAASKETGVTATKKIQRQIESLQTKKLIKRGKKEGEFFKYHLTKLGEKHFAELSAEASPAPSA